MSNSPVRLIAFSAVASFISCDDVHQVIVYEPDVGDGKVTIRDIKECITLIDWNALPTELVGAHANVCSAILAGPDVELLTPGDLLRALLDASKLVKPKTVNDFEKALLAKSRLGGWARGEVYGGKPREPHDADMRAADTSELLPGAGMTQEEVVAAFPDVLPGGSSDRPVTDTSQRERDARATELGKQFTNVLGQGMLPEIFSDDQLDGALLAPPAPPLPSLAETLLALPREAEAFTRPMTAEDQHDEAAEPESTPLLGEADPAFAFSAKQRAFEEKLLAEREPRCGCPDIHNCGVPDCGNTTERVPYSVEDRLKFLHARLLDLPKGTPHRTKKIADIHHQIRKLTRKLPKTPNDPMVSNLATRLETLLTPATA